MAANMTVVTNLLNGRRVGRFANRKTLSNDETIQEAIDGGYVVGKKEIIGKLALSLGMDSAALEDGSYPNAKYTFFCYTGGETDSLEIPFRLRKGAM